MKKIFCLIFLFSFKAFASLDQEVLLTQAGDCQLNYLSALPKINWSISLEEGSCEKGFVQGFARVNVYNNEKKLVEKLQGFFIDGYWIGGFAVQKGHVLSRTSPDKDQQALTFILDKEKGINYVVQLRSNQSEQTSYGPFLGCPDFRIMVVVEDALLLKKKYFQDKIALHTLELAHRYCQKIEQIVVFGAQKLKAQTEDIIFQMTIDPETEETELVFQNIPDNQERINEKKKFSSNINENFRATSLTHLEILARLENKPIKGKVVAHIQQLNLDGTAEVDLPETIKLKNNYQLKTGWAIVQGTYFKKEMSVSDIQFCQKEWCLDVQ